MRREWLLVVVFMGQPSQQDGASAVRRSVVAEDDRAHRAGRHACPPIGGQSRGAPPLRDVQEAASHAGPRLTMCYDRGRQSLDGHTTYIVATFVAGASR